MVIESRLLGEPLLAEFAFKRLISRMDAHVRLQVRVLRETFVANVTRDRPFARMCQ